ncbi:nitrile hydratase subunit beta [Aurantimonas sp. C2-6-R+9]|uniref:nitrile hydratase subunit beta n=1 Tax=unclassified Aurantimonas TaxID=2638230 RepID=UPI002E19A0BE|nr:MULTISPECIES: nitrile hydratase subunit beta [unclassified Aurantimonas]MEC5293236.1 nitrile hydratase subunit beta [Aurantimonas sp. C2-3-R2]MEC5323676.1 nitrile hydratase subunit beta [Aurantimonas sp. A3-2-R12]MEC5383475.1 nitrile hydratase subunit beta [Aurantimonas sp. C2-6-R+9]MEC5414335.1 nitrile hydratase subunit beta [Aurantimonas sp. C2-4-R8]
MNGPQDLGGQMGFGPVAPETNEPLFHADWEKRALGLTVAAGTLGAWTIDESRHARESLHPADYYGSSYYEIWTKALEKLLLRHGFVTEDELDRGEPLVDAPTPKRVVSGADMPAVLAKGVPVDRPAITPARFAVGDRVRTIEMHPTGHTRLPRYARGRVGRVDSVHGVHVFPDTDAHGKGEAPQWLYTVAFDGPALWGRDGDPGLTVSIDAFESYLEPVPHDDE